MRLYEVKATEYNGEQEYSQSKLLAAEDIDHARQIARDYFRQWYDDGDEPQKHNTGNPDEFEFIDGCIRLRIQDLDETTIDEWTTTQIMLHSIGALPEELIEIETAAGGFAGNKLKTTEISDPVADLLEACKVLTSYTMDLLYKLDDQIDLDDVEELQQVRVAIARYDSAGTPDTNLRKVCQAGLKFLDSLPETRLTTQLQNRQAFREMLNDALNQSVPIVDDRCPKCGAGHAERDLKDRDFPDTGAIHMHYICNKCSSKITEEFTLTEVFIDNGQ